MARPLRWVFIDIRFTALNARAKTGAKLAQKDTELVSLLNDIIE